MACTRWQSEGNNLRDKRLNYFISFNSLPHIQTNFSPLHQKMYCEMILVYAFNVLKLKLFICSVDESKKFKLRQTPPALKSFRLLFPQLKYANIPSNNVLLKITFYISFRIVSFQRPVSRLQWELVSQGKSRWIMRCTRL